MLYPKKWAFAIWPFAIYLIEMVACVLFVLYGNFIDAAVELTFLYGL